MSIVESHNDWDPLEEVIVGVATGFVDQAYEPALAPFFNLNDPARSELGGPRKQEEVAAAQKQLDGLADRLQAEGVVVRRPDSLDHDLPFATPDFRVPRGHGQSCPRDVLLVVGDHIIEAPMAMRARYFEFRSYRRLLRDYFRGGANWIAAPRPLLDDDTYAPGYTTESEPYDSASHSPLSDRDPLFDAASFLRLGKDIFWQPDIVSNPLGADWLARVLGKDYRLHKLEFLDKAPEHIDTTLVPIRPGLLVSNPERPFRNSQMVSFFESNGWQVIDGPPSVREGLPFAARDVSNWISLNFLSLDENTVIAEAGEQPLHEFLRRQRCDVIPVEFDQVFSFGGSFHCCTLDIRRSGRLASYFPSLG